MLNSEKAQKIRRLHRQGETIRAISNQLDISRNTVRNYPLIVKISFRIFQHHKGTLENAILRGI